MSDNPVNKPREWKINWKQSSVLVEHTAPNLPEGPNDIGDYLDSVETYARNVLADLGIEEPSIPVSLEIRHQLSDQKYNERSADAVVGIRLLEYSALLKEALKRTPPKDTENINLLLVTMAQICGLSLMPSLSHVQRIRARKDNRERDEKIREHRKQGKKVAVLAVEHNLSERQILKICKE